MGGRKNDETGVAERALRVLLLTDVQCDAERIVGRLKDTGYEVRWSRADSAVELLGLLSAHPWDIAICAASSAGYDVVAAIESIRESDADLPIAVISEAHSEEDLISAFRAGADDCLTEDGLDELDACIRRLLQRSRARRNLRSTRADLDALARQRQLALDAAHMGWWHYDPVTKVSAWDQRYGEIFGVTGFEAPNDEILLRLHPDDLPHVWAAVEAALDPVNPQSYSVEYRVNMPGGTVRWVEAWGIATFEGEGDARHATSFVGTVLDITDRKCAEDELIRHHNMLNSIIENAAEAIFVKDVNGRYLSINTTGARMLAHTVTEVIGHVDNELVSPETAHEFHVTDSRVILLNQDCLREETVAIGGQVRTFRSHKAPWRDNLGNVMGIIGVSSDITESTAGQERLRESEKRYRTFFDEATEGIALANADTGEIIDCNRAMEDLTGYAREELVGKSQTILHPKDDVENGVSRTFHQHRTDMRGSIISTEVVTKRGEMKRVEIKANVVEVDGKNVVQAFFRDVTSEVRHSQERETTVRLLRLLNAQSDIRELVRGLTSLLQEWTGCEAVGVRLSSGDDYPYFETRGYPAEFIEKENFLCVRTEDGGLCLDPVGKPLLDCMCGAVLTGRTTPSAPFFTSRGSFWTNSGQDLHAAHQNRPDAMPVRGNCVAEGYESVAMIPLRTGGITLGMLQLDDHRRNRFTPELITFLEHAADQFAIALAQRRAQEASRESELHYRSLFANMLNCFAYCRMLYDDVGRPVDFVYLEVNDAFAKQTGLTNVTGRRVSEVIPNIWEKDAALLEVYGRVADSGTPERFEWFVRSMGMWYDVSVYSPGKGYFVAIFDVITRRKEAEAELRKLSVAVSQSPASVVITDLEGRIDYVNPRFSETTGYALDEVRGQTPRLLKSGETPAEEYAALWRTIANGGEWRGVFRNRKKDGTLYWDRVFIAPVRDGSGAITHYLRIGEDITQQKNLEDQYRQAQKMEAIGQLAGGVAHDFNNILQAVIGYGQLLLDVHPEMDTGREYAKEIVQAAERASGLTRQLLAFSRRQVLEMADLDLNLVVDDVSKMVRRVIGEDIRLKVVPCWHTDTVHADRGQMEQVILNLCVNARDAMPQGGVLTIETENIVMDDAYCQLNSWAQPGKYVLLSVTDTGCGMDPETQTHIFEPFFTTKELGKGTGLGLATVYGIVRQHQGMVTVYSEIDKGTVFKVYLPGVDRPASVVGGIVLGRPRGGTETILVAEDDEALRKLVSRILQEAGYTVFLAENGEDALARFEERGDEIDLLLLDVVMPRMGGKGVYDALRQRHLSLRFLFSSGYSTNAVHTGFVLREGIELIQKPYAPDALLYRIRKILDAPRAEDEEGIVRSGQSTSSSTGSEDSSSAAPGVTA